MLAAGAVLINARCHPNHAFCHLTVHSVITSQAGAEFEKLQKIERMQSEFMKKTLQEYDKATNIPVIWRAESEAVTRRIDQINPETVRALVFDPPCSLPHMY